MQEVSIGCTQDRLLNANGDDLMTFSDTQCTNLFNGLKATHGEDSFREIMQEMSRRHCAEWRLQSQRKQNTLPFVLW
ncbi:uncharacterized protein N7518_007578 [Penicillium psychrosexuale]|uniref:uncharacterized protein n=1 Tax=Penicillium psychrosexuale TaxID=1002107 RepID=UPI0025452614|nr:uncharacterized protein N7518_007578 [Penicillium psychrosexuale]KAJ5790567.1 hypothetical protein N7518_007578 [Penicillium psychrosexuale]